MISGARFWLAVAVTYAGTAAVLSLLQVPSAFLFAGVIAGALAALRASEPRTAPVHLQRFGLATVGIAAGGQIDAEIIQTVAAQPTAILGCVAATMAITMLCGQLLRFSKDVSSTTAAFASIAGAASGVTAVVREAGGDDAVVMAIQYLRVVAVLMTVPIAASVLGGGSSGADSITPAHEHWDGLAFTVVALTAGLTLARVLSFSASRLVLPLLVATGLSIGGALGPAVVPPVILAAGYASIGLMVGLSMTPQTIRLLLRILPLALLQLVLSLAGCAALGVAMAHLLGITMLDGYLAATPGGLPAVAAIAISSGASVGIVVTVQLVRLFLALILAAVLGEWITRRGRGQAGDPALDTGG